MSGNGHYFVEWKEEFVSQEQGNRVVHYFLKDSTGESVLAVVGTERSVRHMFYVIAEDFLEAYGKENSVHAGFKWRSRREVVDWLTSMLSKQHLHVDRSESLSHDSTQGLGFPEYAMNGISSQHAQAQDDTGRLGKNFRGFHSDIVWSGSPWMCGKQLKHYPSFCRNGITIPVQSFVFVMAKRESHYVAYLEDMYEDKRGQKKVKVRWFHHNQEVKGVVPLRNPHPKEVFFTPNAQVISAECVDGVATVLNREHYEKCLAAIPHGFLVKVHMCYRQYRNNGIKPFDLSKLRGYFDQPILSCLSVDSFTQPESCNNLSWEEEDDEMGRGESVKHGKKRTRSTPDHSKNKRSAKDHHPMACGSCNGSLEKGLFTMKHISGHAWFDQVFKVDDKIELLCQDSGIRGCWFRCTILQKSKKQIKVQYNDLQDEDGCGNLEEWVPAFKLAMPDKLGMRHSGRPTIRPALPSEPIQLSIEVGAAIDAWWSDGWWEGIVNGVDSSAENVQVFLPGEGLLLTIDKKNVRKSRDWLVDRWVNIEAKPEAVSAISAPLSSSGTKPSLSSSIKEDLASAKPITEEENQNLKGTASTSSDDPPMETEKSSSLRDDVEDGVDADDTCNNINRSKTNDDNANQDGKVHDGNEDAEGSEGDIIKELETSEQISKTGTEMTEVKA